jgi:hypothetical protein
MMRHPRLEHRFIKNIPDRLDPGVLYVSMEYATAAHSCCCGCGEEIVTPFTPTDWKLTFNGEAISLWPSIGNWNLACRSHYVIREGRVIEARPWSDREIADERLRDKAAKRRHYGTPGSSDGDMAPTPPDAPRIRAAWSWIKRVLPRRG